MFEICTYIMRIETEHLNINEIKLKNPTSLGHKLIFNIKYMNENCIFQTPDMIIPHSPLRNESDNSLQFDCCNDKFVKHLDDISTYILQRMHKARPHLLQNKNYVNKVKDGSFGKILRLKINNESDIEIFDQYKTRLNGLSNITAQKKIQMILWIKWFWVSRDYYGIEYSIVQLKITMPPSENLFQEHDSFTKYKKMLAMKIPLQAVEHKMKLDGCSNDDIVKFQEISKNGQVQKTPSIDSAQCPTRPSFLGQIARGEFSLKKTIIHVDEQEEKKKAIMMKMARIVDMSKKVPTLDDILTARSNLRKI